MISMDEARARVARGAAHLDKVRPGWEHQIDVGTLTLHDICGCIAGQLGNGGRWSRYDEAGYRKYEQAFSLIATGVGGADDISGSVRAGIFSYYNEDYPVLQDAWIEAICDRRLRAAEPAPVETVTT